MTSLKRILACSLFALAVSSPSARAGGESPQWEPAGWGGGGFYFGAAFHPAKDGVLYLGGNTTGMYKSEDHGRHWRLINKGLTNYIVHAIAVDRLNPDTLYASTVGGLHKSTDAGETWRFIEKTGKADLRLTGERDLSIQPLAVDPSNGDIVYAGSPGGTVCKSTDGARTWRVAYRPETATEAPGVLRVQFGGAGGEAFGGVWFPLTFPAALKPADCGGFAFSFNGGVEVPQRAFVTLTTRTGIAYLSKNLADRFGADEWKTIVLGAADFTLSDSYAKKNPGQARSAPPSPDWGEVVRMDFSVVGPLANRTYVTLFKDISFASTREPAPVKARDFAVEPVVQSYGNVRIGAAGAGTVYSVDVAPKKPARVAAATADSGVILSDDAGATWRPLDTPRNAASVVFDPADADVLYAAFGTDGVRKST
ncbi:MAG TPA: hypothetical protein VIO38_14110, partial [Rariglobus sp.]